MTFTTPLIGITAAVVFFYLKIVFMQWRKARTAAKVTNLEIARARKQGKTPKIPDKPSVSSGFSIKVTNWGLAVTMVGLVFIGFVVMTVQLGLGQEIMDNAWILVAAAFVGLSFAVN